MLLRVIRKQHSIFLSSLCCLRIMNWRELYDSQIFGVKSLVWVCAIVLFSVEALQALHALIDLIKWTFSPLAVQMHRASLCRQTLSFITQSVRPYLHFTERSTIQSVPQSAAAHATRCVPLRISLIDNPHRNYERSERHRGSSKHYDSHLLSDFPQWEMKKSLHMQLTFCDTDMWVISFHCNLFLHFSSL